MATYQHPDGSFHSEPYSGSSTSESTTTSTTSSSSGSSSSSTLPPSSVYIRPEQSATGEGVWVNYATQKIVTGSDGKLSVQSRTTSIGTPARIPTSGSYASPISGRQLTFEEQQQEIESYNYARDIAEKSRNRFLIDQVNQRVQGISLTKTDKAEPIQEASTPSFFGLGTKTGTREESVEYKQQESKLRSQFTQTLALAGIPEKEINSMSFGGLMSQAMNYQFFSEPTGEVGVAHKKTGLITGVNLAYQDTPLTSSSFIGAGDRPLTYTHVGTFVGTPEEIRSQMNRGILENTYVAIASAGAMASTSPYEMMIGQLPPNLKNTGLTFTYKSPIQEETFAQFKGTTIGRPLIVKTSGSASVGSLAYGSDPFSITASKGQIYDTTTIWGSYTSANTKPYAESGTFRSSLISSVGIDTFAGARSSASITPETLNQISTYYMGDVQIGRTMQVGSASLYVDPYGVIETQTGSGVVARTELFRPQTQIPFTTQPIFYETTSQNLYTGASMVQTGLLVDVTQMMQPQTGSGFTITSPVKSTGKNGDLSWLRQGNLEAPPVDFTPTKPITKTGTQTIVKPVDLSGTFTATGMSGSRPFPVTSLSYSQVQPLALQMPFTDSRSISGTRNVDQIDVRSFVGQIPDVKPFGQPDIVTIPKIKQVVDVKPIVGSVFKFDSAQSYKQVTQTTTTPVVTTPTAPVVTPPPFDPIGGGGIIPSLWWDTEFKGQKGSKGWTFKYKRPRAYTPSVTASAFKITAPASSINMKKAFTGLEVRPIPIFKKIRKKKKKKVKKKRS